MRNVINSRFRSAVWMVLTVAFIVYISIPSALAQGRTAPADQKVSQADLIRAQMFDQLRADRAKFIEGIVGKWASLTGDRGVELRMGLVTLSDDKLVDANMAPSMQAINQILFVPEPNLLGSNSADLVFNKLTPCRLLDTRLTAAGPLIAGANRSFETQGDLSAQGGNAAGCGVPGTDPAALFVILVAVDAQGNGNLRAFPKDAAIPNAVVINYNSSNNLANSAIVPLKQDSGDPLEFTLRANVSNTDAVADVVGYFWSPQATPVDNQTTATTTAALPVGNFTINSPACPSGYRLTGGGIRTGTFNTMSRLASSRPNVENGTNSATVWTCQGTLAVADEIICTAVCSRIPGH